VVDGERIVSVIVWDCWVFTDYSFIPTQTGKIQDVIVFVTFMLLLMVNNVNELSVLPEKLIFFTILKNANRYSYRERLCFLLVE